MGHVGRRPPDRTCDPERARRQRCDERRLSGGRIQHAHSLIRHVSDQALRQSTDERRWAVDGRRRGAAAACGNQQDGNHQGEASGHEQAILSLRVTQRGGVRFGIYMGKFVLLAAIALLAVACGAVGTGSGGNPTPSSGSLGFDVTATDRS